VIAAAMMGLVRAPIRRRHSALVALAVLGFIAASVSPATRPALGTHDCGLPHGFPLWIEFGAGSVAPAVREVFARPGVVVAGSGTALPAEYRAKGAATVFFVLNLPPLVGQPATPADPATVVPEADQLYDRAVASTACATPWIALNELLGPAAATPWTPSTAQYRANVLTLVQRLAGRGARPALLVHGDPNVAGDAAAWWASVGRSATIVYESYYNARNIGPLGPVVGNRRMRLGMRSIVRRFVGAGVPVDRIGFMMGFHVALGTGGREGLQPREEWFRVVKWEALTARQIARDERTPTIWSWGWGDFGPQSLDPDKPAAACVYLWTRDPALCDGPAVAGPAFNRSLTEGQIVLPSRVHCGFAGGTIKSGAVAELQRLTRDRHAAVTALFYRSALGARVRVPSGEILRAEKQLVDRVFRGSRKAYVRALQQRRATVAVARGVVADELRRRRIAAQHGRAALTWAADLTSAAADTATCVRDELPGYGDFPRSNKLDVDVVPLPAFLPFLFRDRRAPAAPEAPVVSREGTAVVLDWRDAAGADLAGYHVYRSTTAGGPYTKLTRVPLVRSTHRDASPPDGATVFYVVRAIDTSRNASPSSPAGSFSGASRGDARGRAPIRSG
jgi:hypothetical protein